MPATYLSENGRWRVTARDDHFIDVYDLTVSSQTPRQTVDSVMADQSAVTRPEFVPVQEFDQFSPVAARAAYNLRARLLQPRRWHRGVSLGLPANGWELDASVVGLAGVGVDPRSLPAYTGSYTLNNGALIEGVKLTQPLILNVPNGRTVTLRKCWLTEQVKGDWSTTFAGSLVIEDCLFDTGARGADEGSAYYDAITLASNGSPTAFLTMRRSVIRGWGRGWWVDVDALIEHCVYEMGTWFGNPATTGSHNEAVTHRDTSHPVFRACRLDCGPYVGADRGQQNLSAVVQCQGNGSSAGNLTLDSCLLALPSNLLGQPHVVADFHVPGSIVDGTINVVGCRFSPASSAYNVSSFDKGDWRGNFRYDPRNPPSYQGEAVV